MSKVNKRLHELVENYVEYCDKQVRHKKELIEKIEEDLQKEIIAEEKERILSEVNDIQTKRQLQIKIAEAKEIAVVAIVIGFFVGLAVNQITDLISILKQFQSEYVIILSLIMILIFLLGIYLSLKFLYIDKISKIIEEH